MAGVGDSIDRFVIEAVLGEGGMGRVYRAVDPRLGRRVALKVLLASAGGEDERREAAARMLREARAAAAFTHPNVVAVYEVGEHQGAPYIVMELVSGTTLRHFVSDARVPVERKVAWLLEVARGLGAAHRAGLVHRDIKPDNVMVTSDGAIKVLDFGVARASEGAGRVAAPTAVSSEPSLTAEGMAVGTPKYMAPEQIRGLPLDGRVDQFAWGVMACELLSGEAPWPGHGASMQLLAAVLTAPVAPLRGRVPGVDSRTSDAIGRALEKRAEDRFPTMEALIAAIESAPAPAVFAPAGSADRISQFDPIAPTAQIMVQTPPVPVAPTVPMRRGRGRAVWPLLGGLALAAVMSGWLGARQMRRELVSAPLSPTAAPHATACSEAPAATSKIPEAEAAFRAAIQAGCDANPRPCWDGLDRAVQLDPTMAAAQVRRAAIAYSLGAVGAARTAMQAAMQLRTSLSERDGALLGILEPQVLRSPPDLREAERRADEALGRWGLDAGLWLERARIRLEREAYAGARDDAARAGSLDPGAALASELTGRAYQLEGRDDEALAAFAQCLKQSPMAIDCISLRTDIHRARQQCAAIGQDAQTVVTVAPTYEFGYRLRAQSLAWSGAPALTLSAALEQAWQHARPEHRDDRRAWFELLVAGWTGDLEAAEKAARAQLSAGPPDAPLERHARPAWMLAEVLVEQGRLRDAGAVAADFLARRTLWAASTQNAPAESDGTPRLLDVARRAGLLDEATAARERDAWAAQWSGALKGGDVRRAVALAAYVVPVETRQDALAAAERIPGLLPLPPDWLGTGAFALGKAYLLAGKAAEAIPYLERAKGSCDALEQPIATARAAMMLGHALAATGDPAGACAAYQGVMTRWAGLRGRSVTLEETRRAARSLACRAPAP